MQLASLGDTPRPPARAQSPLHSLVSVIPAKAGIHARSFPNWIAPQVRNDDVVTGVCDASVGTRS